MIMGDSQTRGKRIVDLCIYVDENIYKENHDQEKIFNYIYTIVNTLAVKQKLFKNWDDYEGFSLEFTSKLYQRLTNPKQFLPDDDPKKLKKIKSILNYIKKSMYPMKVDYQNDVFNQRFDPVLHSQTVLDLREKATQICRDQPTPLMHVDFEYYLRKITHTVKMFLKTSPYRNDKAMMNNLYISCMMTFLNQITLNNYNKKRYKNRLRRGYNIDGFLNKVYILEQEYSVVLFHLPDNLHNYVATLVNQIKKFLVKDMRELIGSFELPDSFMQAIIASSMGESRDDQE